MAAIDKLPKAFDLKRIMTEFVHNIENQAAGIGVGKQGFLEKYYGTYISYPMSLALPDVEKFQAFSEDVVICGAVKTGASRFSALVGMIMHDADPDYFYNEPDLQEKVPWLEFCTAAGEKGPRGLEQVSLIPSPRAYWTRLNYNALPPTVREKNAKVVYHLRHPKDSLVTLYYHYLGRRNTNNFKGTLDDIVNSCVNDNISTGPFFDHYVSAWTHRNDPNLFICSFEDFSEKPFESVKSLSLFLGKRLTDEQIEQVAHDGHFDQMSRNPHSNHSKNEAVGEFDATHGKVMRSGKPGAWKEHLTREQNEKINMWMEKNLRRPELQGIKDSFNSTFIMEDL